METTDLVEFFWLVIDLIGVTMAKALKTSGNGRKCAFPHCKRLLSIYNHEAYCHIHRDQVTQKQLPKTPYHHAV